MPLGTPLSAQQLRFFDTFGYLGFPGLMKHRIDEIISEFEAVWSERGGGHYGKPHNGKARSCVVPFIDQREKLAALLDSPEVMGIASSLLGDDFNYMGSDGNYYVGDTGWHSDGWHDLGRHIKIAFYLDPVTKDSGCLRVIPGSHKVGDSYSKECGDVGRSQEVFGLHGSQVPAIALETVPGDLLVFNHNTKHSSWHGGTNRRMFTINLCQRYPDERLQDLRDYIGGAARFWIDRVYGPAMVRTAGPERQRHLEQVLANDGHLAALSAKARTTMAEPSRG